MLIKALCDYYDILCRRGALIPDSRSNVKVSYAVDLTESGEVVRVRSVKEKISQPAKDGGEKVFYRPRNMVFPKRVEKSAVYSNELDHRPLYLFGLDCIEGEYVVTPKAEKSHDHFVKVNSEFFANLNDPLSKAFLGFIEKWNPSADSSRQLLESIKQDYSSARFAFCLDGYPNDYLNESKEVLNKFDAKFAQIESNAPILQCSVLGEFGRVAVLHNVIKGVVGGNSTGCKLVCVNNESEESYGDSQGAVGKISETAMQRYTAALNYLTDAANKHKVQIDDTTVLFWADAVDEDSYIILNNLLLGNDYSTSASETDLMLESAITQIKRGQKPDFSVFKADMSTDYYIVGILPNAARLAVKFAYRNTFGKIMEHVLQYHSDFVHGNNDDGLTKAPSFREMRGELLPKESKSAKLAPDFVDKMFLSMINGAPYPRMLLENVVRRCRVEAKITNVKVGLIKAYLNRKNKTEVIPMSLNKENQSPAYLSGRLFAVLEPLQQKASGGKLNSTIKDTYFASACATPSVVFPRLMQLAQNHLKKCDDGYSVYCDRMIGQIIDGLDNAFPKTLSLEQQGEFIVGYYQQKSEIYAKKGKE